MADTRVTILRAARLFEAGRGDLIEGAAVLIDGQRIAQVGRASDVRPPAGVEADVVDYGDATILPGFVDVHTHVSFPGDGTPGEGVASEESEILAIQAAQNARRMLASGVTTARENGAKGRVGFAIRDAIKREIADGPDFVVCGRPITMTGGHMWYLGSEVDGPADVRREVRQLVKEGADYIKIVATGGSTVTSDRFRPSFDLEELTAITDETHRLGRLAAAHCSSTQGIVNSLDAGVDMIIHGYFYEADRRYTFRPDVADRMAAAAWMNPTLFIRQAEIDAITRRGEAAGGLTPTDQRRLDRSRQSLDDRLDAVRRCLAAGVRVVAGSDSAFGWYAAGHFVEEVRLLAAAGMSNRQAILAATSEAAASIGRSDSAGSLEVGRRADVVVVEGDPLADLRALSAVRSVHKSGALVTGVTA
jgi:imidazolonepropionase-like amidohydrolase